ncbi:MAG: DUF2267 domain-containing protein [Beijerinckiaceae bacterium]|nr:DUF2267 domain-containing protein [Beijerinckiaceae bacterium]
MEELVQRVSDSAGIDAATAEKAIGMILGFLRKEGPSEEVGQLMQAIPGSEDVAAPSGGGGIMGMVGGLMGGGGVMGLGAQLMGVGVSMDQIGKISKELFAYGREKAGEDVMGGIVGNIPGLSQFV